MGDMRHELLEQKMCHEIEIIEDKYKNGNAELSMDDLKKLDLLYHALKSKATFDAMKEAEGYGYSDQMSGRSYPRMSGTYREDRGPAWNGYPAGGYSGNGWQPHPPRW